MPMLRPQTCDPKSNDPDATIKQAYTQSEPSGGFLHVQCTPGKNGKKAQLAFGFYDEKGLSCIKNTVSLRHYRV